VGLLFLYAVITVPLAVYLNLWIDESYTLVGTAFGLLHSISYSNTFMYQPPLYYASLCLWRMVSGELWWARMSSVLMVGIALWWTHRASARWFPNVSSAWAVLPLLFNPFVIYAATEVRPYPMILLCAALLMYHFHDAFMVERATSAKSRVYFGLFTILSAFVYYYLAFIVVGLGVALLAGRRWQALRRFAVVAGISGAFILPQAYLASHQSRELTGHMVESPGLARSVEYALARVVAMEISLFDFAPAMRLGLFGVVVAVCVVGVAVQWRAGANKAMTLPVVVAVVAVSYVLMTWKVSGENSFSRHFMVALIPLHLMFVSFASSFGNLSPKVMRTGMGVIAAVGVVASGFHFAPMAKVGDFRRAARYIEANESPGERIFLVINDTEYPFTYYYRGPNEIVPLPAHDPLERFDFSLWVFDSEAHVRSLLAGVKPGETVWLYTDRGPDSSFFGVFLGINHLEAVMSDDFELESEQDFYEAKVRHLRRK